MNEFKTVEQRNTVEDSGYTYHIFWYGKENMSFPNNKKAINCLLKKSGLGSINNSGSNGIVTHLPTTLSSSKSTVPDVIKEFDIDDIKATSNLKREIKEIIEIMKIRKEAKMFLTAHQDMASFLVCCVFSYKKKQPKKLASADIIMPSLGEFNLDSFLEKSNNVLSFKNRILLAQKVLHELNRVHNFGIIHRDIKPDQFVLFFTELDKIENVRLCDFGASKYASEEDRDEYREYDFLLDYEAPEILRKGTSEQTDMYALTFVLGKIFGYNIEKERGLHFRSRSKEDFIVNFNSIKTLSYYKELNKIQKKYLDGIIMLLEKGIEKDINKRPSKENWKNILSIETSQNSANKRNSNSFFVSSPKQEPAGTGHRSPETNRPFESKLGIHNNRMVPGLS